MHNRSLANELSRLPRPWRALNKRDKPPSGQKRNEGMWREMDAAAEELQQERSGAVNMQASTGSRLFAMFKDGIGTDVTIIIRRTKIKCHGIVVRSCNSILKDLLETNRTQIDIGEDMTPQIFKTVLIYMYTNKARVTDSNIFELLHATYMLQFLELEQVCAQFISTRLSDNNIAFFVEEALNFDTKATLQLCQDYFASRTVNILRHPGFSTISHAALLCLCSSERLNCSELDLFQACQEWATHACNRRKYTVVGPNLRYVLGDVVNKIRFPCMNRQEFDQVIDSGILTFEEIGQVLVNVRRGVDAGFPFSCKDRTKPVQIVVEDAWQCRCIKRLPRSTAIASIKRMAIWHGGACNYPRADFTLGHKGQELDDHQTMASLGFAVNQKSLLKVHSLRIMLSEYNGGEYLKEEPLSVNVRDLRRVEDVIKGFIYAKYGHKPDDVVLFMMVEDIEQKVWHILLEPGTTVYWYRARNFLGRLFTGRK